MGTERQDGPGCLGVIVLVAPFIAGAINENLVTPVILGSCCLAGLIGIGEWWGQLGGVGKERIRGCGRGLLVLVGILFILVVPALFDMSPNAGASYIAYFILLGGLWLCYFVVKAVIGK